MYAKLAGMTGTAATEAEELFKVYKLEVTQIPTNKPMVRADHADLVYRTEQGKWDAVVGEVKDRNDKGQPVLIGTTSVEKSERLSEQLQRHGIKHEVLNAKNHEREALIIERAGQRGAVTLSTNMAGRGVDIILGDGIVQVGGLHVIGTERHEARRIDNQLRGRSGRQGDPGSSRFYVSLEDDLMRIFAADRISGIMQRLGMEEGVPIESRFVSKQIENAQKRVEGQNFSYRKHVLEYDDVMNKQREAVYGLRKQLLEGEDQKEYLMGIADDIIIDLVARHASEKTHPDEWDFNGLQTAILQQFGFDFRAEGLDPSHMSSKEIEEALIAKAHEKYDQKETLIGSPPMRYNERMLMLQIVDSHWKDHLLAMDHLKEGLGPLRYGHRES